MTSGLPSDRLHQTNRRAFLATGAKAVVGLGLGSFVSFPRDGAVASNSPTRHGRGRFRFLLSDPRFVYSRPCFSPDGSRVLFMRAPADQDPHSDDSSWSLWTIPAAGGEPELFFEHPLIRPTRPQWCASVDRIAFSGVRANRAELWLMDGDGTSLTHVPVGDPPHGQLYYPSWYPDGSSVAVTDYQRRRVLRVQLDTGGVVPLTNPRQVWAGMCSVSPDSATGNPLAFAGQKPDDRYNSRENRIWLQRPGQPPHELDGRQGRNPAWSPSGDLLAFASVRSRLSPTYFLHRRKLPAGISAIWIGAPDETAPPNALTPFDCHAVHPKWSPDGGRIVCTAYTIDTEVAGIAVLQVG